MAKVPYGDLIVDDAFIRRLKDGFRMDKPKLAPNFIGQLMWDCWKLEPHERPTFSQLAESLSVYIEASICANYLQMDYKQQYLEMNKFANSVKNIQTANQIVPFLAHVKIAKSNDEIESKL